MVVGRLISLYIYNNSLTRTLTYVRYIHTSIYNLSYSNMSSVGESFLCSNDIDIYAVLRFEEIHYADTLNVANDKLDPRTNRK